MGYTFTNLKISRLDSTSAFGLSRCLLLSVAYGITIFLFILLIHYMQQLFFGEMHLYIPIEINHRTVTNIVFVTPFLETVFLQFGPYYFCRMFGLNTYASMASSIMAFAAFHFGHGTAVFVINGILGGALLIVWFAFWYNDSKLKALAATITSHLIHNVLVLCITTVK